MRIPLLLDLFTPAETFLFRFYRRNYAKFVNDQVFHLFIYPFLSGSYIADGVTYTAAHSVLPNSASLQHIDGTGWGEQCTRTSDLQPKTLLFVFHLPDKNGALSMTLLSICSFNSVRHHFSYTLLSRRIASPTERNANKKPFERFLRCQWVLNSMLYCGVK